MTQPTSPDASQLTTPGPDTHPPSATPPTPRPAPRPAGRKWLLLVVGGVALLAVIGGTAVITAAAVGSAGTPAPTASPTALTGWAAEQQAPEKPLIVAANTCDRGRYGVTVADGNKTLIVDTGAAYDQTILSCVLDELKAPESVRSQIAQTRALDGRQQATWGDFSASWTYHPDSGLDMIVTAA
ncbi:hypothetical protein [Catenuloplanes japonicus]|uniref:hypothetical protein n=1 Tax=Catenuloplanes japonicus TaxID=33876 RepID=UPI000525B8EB|nr:hypothetical protein [Catenuloplanes japonicus]